MSTCIIPNCRKIAPATEPFCSDHRDKSSPRPMLTVDERARSLLAIALKGKWAYDKNQLIPDNLALAALTTAIKLADEARAVALEEGFELGFNWSMMLRGQTLENSRAVGRTLYCDLFKPYASAIAREASERGFNSFEDAESGIVASKAIIRAALRALIKPAAPSGEES